MTTYGRSTVKCAVCGQKMEIRIMTSRYYSGKNERLLDYYIPFNDYLLPVECASCGNISYDIGEKPKFDIEYLNSKEFLTCGGIAFRHMETKRLYKRMLLDLKIENFENAYNNLLKAAWFCDLYEHLNYGLICRKKLSELWENIPSKVKEGIHFKVRHIDVLRRAGLFEDAENLCKTIIINDYCKDDDDICKIVNFQLELVEKRDTDPYTTEKRNYKKYYEYTIRRRGRFRTKARKVSTKDEKLRKLMYKIFEKVYEDEVMIFRKRFGNECINNHCSSSFRVLTDLLMATELNEEYVIWKSQKPFHEDVRGYY